MASQLQIDANRNNSKKSTGPKTDEGKAAVSRNACTHGLRSRDVVIPQEDPSQFQALLDAYLARFQPADSFEESLVRQLAAAEWRMRRLTRVESGIFTERIETIRDYEDCPDRSPALPVTREESLYDENTFFLGDAFRQNCGGGAFNTLMRYENSIRRSFFRALEQLRSRDQTKPMCALTARNTSG